MSPRLGDPKPPPREAHCYWTHEGVEREAAVLWPLWRMMSWVKNGLDFAGDFTGRAELVDDRREAAAISFRAGGVEGEIELALTANGWIRIEAYVDGERVFRCWAEQPYEEIECWPDGADGVGEGPGRISKRGAWLQFSASAFVGLPANQHGQFDLRDPSYSFLDL
jgi:hypothetical protein